MKLEKIAEQIERHLVGWKTASEFIIPNVHTILLRVRENEPFNSNLIIARSQFGKTTFLRILEVSCKEVAVMLPERIFEYYLVTSYFVSNKSLLNRKTWLISDAILTFGGTTRKQRTQLFTMLNELLVSHRYRRKDRYDYNLEGDVNVFMAIATEYFKKWRFDLFEETTLNRLIPVKVEISEERYKDIASKILRDNEYRIPKIEMPVTKYYEEAVEENGFVIPIPENLKDDVVRLAFLMKSKSLIDLAFTSCLIHVRNWLKAVSIIEETWEVRKEYCKKLEEILNQGVLY